jgi:hypothetical protein
MKQTFFEKTKGLPIRKDALDIDSNGSLVGILSSYHSEAKALVTRSL